LFSYWLKKKKKKKKRGKERKEKEKDNQKIEANKSKIRTKATVKYFLQQSTHLFQVRLFSLSLSLSPSLSVGALFIVGAPRQNDQISGIPPQFQSFFFSLCVSPNSTELKSLS
jgi:hypothetical protein